jgi:hypothetical protein
MKAAFSLSREQIAVLADGMASAMRTSTMIVDGLGVTGVERRALLDSAAHRVRASLAGALRQGGCPEDAIEEWVATIIAALEKPAPRPVPAIVIRGGEISLAGARGDEEDDAA